MPPPDSKPFGPLDVKGYRLRVKEGYRLRVKDLWPTEADLQAIKHPERDAGTETEARRLRTAFISHRDLKQVLTGQVVIQGIPDGAEIVRLFDCPEVSCIGMHLRHASFDVIPPGNLLPDHVLTFVAVEPALVSVAWADIADEPELPELFAPDYTRAPGEAVDRVQIGNRAPRMSSYTPAPEAERQASKPGRTRPAKPPIIYRREQDQD